MKTSKKVISIILCFIMLVATMSLGFSAMAAGDTCNCGVTPVLYVKGRTNIYKDPSLGEGSENLAEMNFSGDTDAIIDTAANILTAFGAALLTDKWDNYCDVLFEEIKPLYDGYKLNNDGEKGEGNTSGISEDWQLENLLDSYVNSTEGSVKDKHTDYATDWAQFTQYQYDMRLDPRDNADGLNAAIKRIIELTGHNKINIICRCEGNVIVNAYLNEYGYDDIEGVVMYNSIAMGAEIADEMYTNKVVLDPDAVNRFVNTFIDTSPILDFVKATVNLATYNGLLGEGLGFVTDIYNKISSNLIPRLIREIFGTCPGWWGMISPDVCDEAIEFVLETDNEDGKYDKLIEKIYGYNELKANATNILKEAQKNGVKVYILAKYGDQMYPVIESYDALGDGVVSLDKQTFCGATTSKITETLSEDYIQSRVDAGFGKYISADKMVDGSTAPFADYTWYVKELRHDNYPWSTDFFMLDLLNSDSYVKATEEFKGEHGTYTQYMLFEEYIGEIYNMPDENIGILHPLTEENKDVGKDTTDTSSIFAVLLKWLTSFFNFIASLFNK